MIILRVIFAILGAALVAWTFLSAAKTFVVPRSHPQALTGFLFKTVRGVFDAVVGRLPTYEQRDQMMALYAPIALLLMVPFWLLLTAVGYAFIYWALGITPWTEAFVASGSSLLTLGYVTFDSFIFHLFSFSEAVLGLMLVAMLIAYLPTMYSAFAQREKAVSLLQVRAGVPPTAPELLWRLRGLDLDEADQKMFWRSWEEWFYEVDENHTSLAPLVFFRSPRSGLSWVVAAGVVLDSAALTISLLDNEDLLASTVVLPAGIMTLRHIAGFFSIPYDRDPQYPRNPIGVTREEFDAACERLEMQGLPLKEDRDLAWENFAGWRVNYDETLQILCDLTMAPDTPWLSEYTMMRADSDSGETGAKLVKVQDD